MPTQSTGKTWKDSDFAKDLILGLGKEGKTTALVAYFLGQMPCQKQANSGGIITKPEHLHIFAFDAATLDGIREFLRDVLKAPEEALNYDAWNFQKDIDRVRSRVESDGKDFYDAVINKTKELRSRIKPGEVHAFLYSSVTNLIAALKREISGRPVDGANMDQYRWDAYNARCAEIRTVAHEDNAHCVWEGHALKGGGGGQSGQAPKESIGIQGRQAGEWALNVSRIYRLRRERGAKWPGTKCDKVYFDTKPSLEGDYMISGRGVHTLADREENLTEVYAKQGLKVGRWGRQAVAAAPKAKAS